MPSEHGTDGAANYSFEVKDADHGITDLPGADDELWEKTALGNPSTWSPVLHAFGAFINNLPYPAAILWGERLLLIHNGPWKAVADGSAQQGASQKEKLPEEALSLIRTAMLGRTRRSLTAENFLNNEAQDGRSYIAHISPIRENEKTTQAVVVQLFVMTEESERRKMEKREVMDQVQSALKTGIKDDAESARGRSTTLDKLSLDENPFFQKFASMLPTGMAILNHKAEAVFVNEQFFELTTSPESNFTAWPNSIHADDYDRVMEAYKTSFGNGGKALRIEFRTQAHKDPWRLLMLSPLSDSRMSDESVERFGGFVCAVIDISPNKAQELAQKKAAQEATERKEQQERFIDMISHEIRNPLSAVLHCAEEIAEEVETAKHSGTNASKGSYSTISESVETIKLCVAHQKNIVDDILSFSKLDAAMLSLTPRNAQPKRQLGDALKMFSREFRRQKIELEYKVDVSYDDVKVDWVKADMVRVSQVLVNLVTNAIKFTSKKEGEKKITALVGASIERPTSYPPNVVFFDPEDLGFRLDGTNTSEWGNGEALYLMVAVKDNGIGISAENQRKLFQRFRQATPKTEEKYGGSGLGLSISRKLCQLHGGEIGVSSKEAEGSTFGFFIKCRRFVGKDTAPTEDETQTEALRDKIELATSHKAPIEDVDEADVKNESLEAPKVEFVPEVHPGEAGDAKRQETAQAAEDVAPSSTDEYGSKARASIAGLDFSSQENPRTRLEKLQQKTDSDASSTKSNDDANSEPRRDQVHVLLVEDNKINQRILKRRLESRQFKVTPANNGRQAVDAVQMRMPCKTAREDRDERVPFDVILMDQEMPVLDGNAATQEIRQLESAGEVHHVPILGVTANVREEQRQEMLAAGMDDAISKPYTIEDLVRRITDLTTAVGSGNSGSPPNGSNGKEDVA